MMFTVLSKDIPAKDVCALTIEAPQIAAKAQAGQFVVIMVNEQGERIPLTLAQWNSLKGTITIIFQVCGYTTKTLAALPVGASLAHVLGPLGRPTRLENYGTVIAVAGGVGVAEILPVSRAFKAAGNRVVGIVGARSQGLLILEDQMRSTCDELHVATDDGSSGQKGFVTDILRGILDRRTGAPADRRINLVYAIGPVRMMQAVAELTRPCGLKTIVSLNPIMVDATGMCGACRCTVDKKTVFACVDGPDFDAHQVDFAELEKRLGVFRSQEQTAYHA